MHFTKYFSSGGHNFSIASMATKSSFASTNLYTSWNGVTEVKSWRFFGGAGTSTNNVNTVFRTVPKTGFVLILAVNEYVAWGYVEALSGDLRAPSKTPSRQNYAQGFEYDGPNRATRNNIEWDNKYPQMGSLNLKDGVCDSHFFHISFYTIFTVHNSI